MANDARVDILLALRAELAGFDGSVAGVQKLERAVQGAAGRIRQQSRNLGSELDAMGASIRRAFAPSNLARGFLAGAGAGSGIALVGLTISKRADVWKESAEYAKELEARAKSIAEAMQATSRAAREAFTRGLSPEAQRAERLKDAAAIEARMAGFANRRERSTAALSWIESAGENIFGTSNIGKRVKVFDGETFGGSTGLGARDFYQLMQARADEAQAKWNDARDDLVKTRAEIVRLDKEIADAAERTADAGRKVADAKHQQAFKDEEQLRQRIVDALRQQDQELERQAERYRELADPTREYSRQIEEINALHRAGRLEAQQAERAIFQLNQQIVEAVAGDTIRAWEKFYEDFMPTIFGGGANESSVLEDGKELVKLGNELGFAFQSAFEDAILSGQKFSDVLRGLARDLAQIVLRQTITQPLGNWFSGIVGGLFGRGAGAGGGTFVTNGPANLTVGDNPGGVELVNVVPLSGVGRSWSNGSMAHFAGGGQALAGKLGGDTFHFSYSFQGGVTREEVLGVLPQLVEASKAGVLQAMRHRRDGFR
ncbi:MAG TPA: hypothetical protein VEC14_07315 [Reyranellaceae bacterium]|nr:hypothetical protein [Reyranellaceae bacterium]